MRKDEVLQRLEQDDEILVEILSADNIGEFGIEYICF